VRVRQCITSPLPEKHKVYRIGAARVEDGEGLDNPHDAPCLEERVSTPDVEVPDHLPSEREDETPNDQDSDRDGDDVQASIKCNRSANPIIFIRSLFHTIMEVEVFCISKGMTVCTKMLCQVAIMEWFRGVIWTEDAEKGSELPYCVKVLGLR
jgi:hypothetical protein